MKSEEAIAVGIISIIVLVVILLAQGPIAFPPLGNTFTLTFDSYSVTPDPDIAYLLRGVLEAHNEYSGQVMLSIYPNTPQVNTPYVTCTPLGEVNFYYAQNPTFRKQAVIVEVGISHTCIAGTYSYTVMATDGSITRTAVLTVYV